MGKAYNITSEYPIIVGEYPFHKQLKEELVSLLENHPDELGKTSNVKATMTNWDWGNYSKSKRLQRLKECIVNEVRTHKTYATMSQALDTPYGKVLPSLFVKNFWANIYYKGDYTISHDHQDFSMGFSFAYFLKSEWYHPPFVFTHSGEKIKSKEGTYIIFPNHVKHHVPKNRFKETRITLSGNVIAPIIPDESFSINHNPLRM